MTRTTRNAPAAAGTADEGEIETPEEERNDMSNSTANALLQPALIAREPRRTDGITYLDEGQPTAAEVDWAQQHLAGLPVRVEFSKHPVEHWTDGTAWFRCAGFIRLIPGERFELMLREGATGKDLAWLRSIVRRACDGKFIRFGWDRTDASDGSDRYTWTMVPRIRHEADTQFTDDAAPVVRCREANCAEGFHEEEPDLIAHVADRAESKDYTVTVERFEDSQWQLSIDMNDPDLSPAAAISLANDLQYLAATCRQLNDQKAHAA